MLYYEAFLYLKFFQKLNVFKIICCDESSCDENFKCQLKNLVVQGFYSLKRLNLILTIMFCKQEATNSVAGKLRHRSPETTVISRRFAIIFVGKKPEKLIIRECESRLILTTKTTNIDRQRHFTILVGTFNSFRALAKMRRCLIFFLPLFVR